MPDELSLSKRATNVDKAAQAYMPFKKSLLENPFLTQEEKANRLWNFLDSHISVFDD